MQAIGLALLVLFFVVGVMKTCGSLTEVKKPEHALRLFIRFAIAKIVFNNCYIYNYVTFFNIILASNFYKIYIVNYFYILLGTFIAKISSKFIHVLYSKFNNAIYVDFRS